MNTLCTALKVEGIEEMIIETIEGMYQENIGNVNKENHISDFVHIT